MKLKILTLSSVLACVILACSGAGPQVVEDPIPTPKQSHQTDASVTDTNVADSSVADTAPVCIAETNTELCLRTNSQCNVFGAVDNCGNVRQVVNCGLCASTASCLNGKCVAPNCVPTTDAQLCVANDRDCGIVPTLVDNCGVVRHDVFCGPGVCGKTYSCTNNKCTPPACVPETNPAFCSRLVSNCGTKTAPDNCGAVRTVDSCGTLYFNGISGMAMSGGVPAEMNGDVYIEAWINPSSATASIVQVGSGAVPGVGTTLSLSLIGGKLAINGMTDSVNPVTTITVPLNIWTFVYAGVSGGTGHLGIIVNNLRTEQIMKTDMMSTHLVAGDTVVIGSSFVGQMNQIRLWNKTPNVANYHDCMPAEAGLLRQWCFREGSGATTADSFGGVTTPLNGAVWKTGVCQ
jgi:hypothetical protein